jgi:hypothetical protein
VTRPALQRAPISGQTYLFVYALIALFLVLAHGPILDTPFYWDEAGQFIPAALDLFHSGALIPHSTLPNVHPPGVMAYLAVFWHIFGFSISGTRIAMLLMASMGVMCSFLLAIELGREATGTPAFSALVMLCVSPLFFAQSMLAQLDMPAMCFGILALLLFLQDKFRASALACVALVLMKETGLATVGVFACWLGMERRGKDRRWKDAAWYALPVAVLAVWLVILRMGTGHWMGNAAFTQYNLFYPLHPVRLGIALLRRLYYLFVGGGHFIGTGILIWALRRMPLFRSRPWKVAGTFVAVNVVAVSVLGGAVLERYLLPVLPVVYIAFAVAMRGMQPTPRKRAFFALLACLVTANFVNPVYSFPFENNMAFVTFARLGQEVALDLDSRPGQIATTFPMSAALRHADYGYTQLPRDVVELKSFSPADLQKLNGRRPDMVLVYDTAWNPLHLLQLGWVKQALRKYYGFTPPATPEEVAELLSMQVVRRWDSRGMKMVLLVR